MLPVDNAGPSPVPQTVKPGAAPSASQPGDKGPEANREGYIARDRFDAVNERMKAAEMQLQLLQQQQRAAQPQPQTFNQPQNTAPGGMVIPQDTAPAMNLKDPKFQEQWKKKLIDNPAQTIDETIIAYLNQYATPLAQQLEQRVLSQVRPLYQSQFDTARSTYEAQRTAADPSFETIKPLFDQYTQAVIQQNPSAQLDQRTLFLIEQAARLDAQSQGMPVAQTPTQTPSFFSESPGSNHQARGAEPKPQMTDAEAVIARQMGITPERWLASKSAVAGSR